MDVAINVAGQTVWMGESLHTFIGGKSYNDENIMNPGIEVNFLITAVLIMIIVQHAVKYALDHDVYEYGGEKKSVQKEQEKKVEDVESDSVSESILHR